MNLDVAKQLVLPSRQRTRHVVISDRISFGILPAQRHPLPGGIYILSHGSALMLTQHFANCYASASVIAYVCQCHCSTLLKLNISSSDSNDN